MTKTRRQNENENFQTMSLRFLERRIAVLLARVFPRQPVLQIHHHSRMSLLQSADSRSSRVE
jgi:hypothetical protein